MTIYTVHEPLRKDGTSDTNRFVFVRDGFYFWAFLFGPLWILVHRLWLVLLFYIVLLTGIQIGLTALGVPATIKFAVGFLIALLLGLEASSLRRWTHSGRKWRLHGVVSAPDLESAERRFFDGYVTQPSPPPLDPLPPASVWRAPSPSTEVIGLFPEPEPRARS